MSCRIFFLSVFIYEKELKYVEKNQSTKNLLNVLYIERLLIKNISIIIFTSGFLVFVLFKILLCRISLFSVSPISFSYLLNEPM